MPSYPAACGSAPRTAAGRGTEQREDRGQGGHGRERTPEREHGVHADTDRQETLSVARNAASRGRPEPRLAPVQRWGAVRLVLTGLLTGGLIASGATAVVARPHRPARVTVTARVGPDQRPGRRARHPLGPAAAGDQRVSDCSSSGGSRGRWVTVSRPRTDATGRASVRISTAPAGTQRLRVLRSSARRPSRAVSRPVTLTVTATPRCTPRVALVDPDATAAARCLAARLDRWQAAGTMGAGQQLNVSNSEYAAPLTDLGQPTRARRRLRPQGAGRQRGLRLRRPRRSTTSPGSPSSGAVLSVSWHPDNPWTGGRYDDPRPAPPRPAPARTPRRRRRSGPTSTPAWPAPPSSRTPA